jgi:8-oxo-dGTP pyrophosphatase MutT (NUDIX family)
MACPRDYGESVVFCFVKDGRVLCEVREWGGQVRDSIPGGRIDPVDRRAPDYRVAALLRETAEELAVVPTAYRLVGQVWLRQEWLFYVYVVDQWRGDLPQAVLDTGKTLRWVHADDVAENTTMPGLARLIRSQVERKETEQ